jgi:gamma-glutamyl hydrolase
VGILSLPIDQCSFTNGTSCIPSNYVHWLQAAGAQVVPVKFDSTEEEIRALYHQINGVLFTGGGLDLALDSQYVKTAKLLFDLATSSPKDRFPLWGTCMGFQLLHILAAWNDSVLCEYCYDSVNISWPLKLTSNAKSSRFFKALTWDTIRTLTMENSTFNLHHDGIPLDAYSTYPKLGAFFDLLSTNLDRKGKAFASTVQAKDWPIYGVQWHAERNQFQFLPSYAIDHSRAAVRAMFDVASFMVSEMLTESSRSTTPHSFASEALLQATLIENALSINVGFGVMEYYFNQTDERVV